jgi:hypothetical protein
MKGLRRLSLLLLGIALFARPVLAAEDEARVKAREAWIAHLQAELGLNEDQAKEIRTVLETMKPGELTGGGDNGVSSPAAIADRRERSRQAIQKVEAILTPEQRTRWAQMREKRLQERRGAAPAASPAPQASPSPAAVPQG